MSEDTIGRVLGGTFPDPDGGPPLKVATRSVVIADSLAGRDAEVVAELGLGRRLAVVCDENTRAVLGARVADALASVAEVSDIRLEGRPRGDMATVDRIRQASAAADALVAVGSGAINDLCKYAAAQDGKPYAVFATGPSMNGFTSGNASMLVNGHKKSVPAVAPQGVFLDLEVLAGAPPRLIRAGFCDSICRSTAQADWLLAHLLFDQPYREAPFALLAEDEAALIADPEGLMNGSLEAMRRLARVLVLAGFGMEVCGASHPASEGEHLISHYIEMLAPADWPEWLHGEQIGVTTLTMARLQEAMLEGGPPLVRPSTETETDVMTRFGEELGRACWREFEKKRLDEAGAEALNRRIAERWAEIRRRIRAVTVPAATLMDRVARLGAPTTHDALDWPREFYLEAVRHAREVRDRYGFLDLAAESGALDDPAFL